MNQFQALATWAKVHGVDLSRAQINMQSFCYSATTKEIRERFGQGSVSPVQHIISITMYHNEESAEAFRVIKRATCTSLGDRFQLVEGTGSVLESPIVRLKDDAGNPVGYLRVTWRGAYECVVPPTPKPICTPVPFKDDPERTVEGKTIAEQEGEVVDPSSSDEEQPSASGD